MLSYPWIALLRFRRGVLRCYEFEALYRSVLTFCTCVARGCIISNSYGSASGRWNRDTIACSVRRAMLLEYSLVRVRNALGNAPPGIAESTLPRSLPQLSVLVQRVLVELSIRSCRTSVFLVPDGWYRNRVTLVRGNLALLYLPMDLALAIPGSPTTLLCPPHLTNHAAH